VPPGYPAATPPGSRAGSDGEETKVHRESFTILAILLALAGAGPSASRAADWPQWRGPGRNGISAEADWSAKWPESGSKVLWKASVGEGFSGFAVVGKRLYTMGFTMTKGAGPQGGKRPGLDHVWCLDTGTGKPLWEHTYPSRKGFYYGPFVTPAVDGNRVYTLSKFGDLFCLDATSGKVVWKKHVVDDLGGKQPYYGYSCHPLIVGDRLILDIGGKEGPLAGLNKNTGGLVWRAGKGSGAYSCPVAYDAGGTTAVTILLPMAAIGVRANDGRVLWQHPWETGAQSSATMPLVAGTRVFVSASERKQWCALLDVRSDEAKVLWENKNMMNYFNSCVLWKGHLYGIHSTDHISKNWRLRCVDSKTGEVKWENAEPRFAAVTLAGGKLIALTEAGELIIAEARPDRYAELARAKILDGKCWTPPVLCRGRIYCRDHRGTLACLDVSP
jgi:outer membrane protein assembly factor BamB